ncbi:MAG: M23 family metallopeptidase, partial [Actinomycetota bacterium]|nr:M23 family metallopeptidase [Actinomycetota bacterium]
YRAAREDLDAGKAALAKQLESRKAAASKLRKDKQAAYAELDRLAKIEKAHLAKLEAERQAAARRAAPSRQASRNVRTAPTAGRATGVIATGNWICPVQGPRAFSNDWGQPRSGGRLHQGTDILAARGTPVVASVSGTVLPHRSSLGGISYYLNGDDGNVYFGTHLQTVTGTAGHVAAGTVIGTVGNTGNASGGPPHLHFEIHPGGGGAVNPYPTLAKHC